MAENSEPPKMKLRPIIRIGIFLISHSFQVSIVCCTAAVLALLLLPVLAKNTYISENALMPGSASPMLSSQDVSAANKFVKEITSLNFKASRTGIEIPKLIAQHMSNIGGEVSYHKFLPVSSKFHPLHFFTSPDRRLTAVNDSCSSYAINTVGIIRAPRGDGKEAIVLVTPYNSANITTGEALSLGIAYSVFSLLTRVSWLAKDIIWLAADSQYGQYTSVDAWLRDYHAPSFVQVGKLNFEKCQEFGSVSESVEAEISGSFQRAGTMAAALVISISDMNEAGEKDSLIIYAEASNGQMPNLDLINAVNYLAVHGQGFHVKVEKLWSLVESKWLDFLGEIFELVGNLVRSLNPQWKFGIPVAEYVEGTATLASSLYNQALGVPTGPHGAFRDYQVDAITLEILPRISSIHKSRQNEFLLRGGRLIEGVIRSVNNLLEKFHQSFFLYLLTAPNKFVSVGVYMIAFLLLVAPLPVVSASLFPYSSKLIPNSHNPNQNDITFKSWEWLHEAKIVFLVHLWSVIVTLLPFFVNQIPNGSPEMSLLIWGMLSFLTLALLHLILGCEPQSREKKWALLKSVTVSASFIGLCLMSVINFAMAEIGALLIVPLCLMVAPLKLDLKDHTLKGLSRATCNVVLTFLAFPVTAFFVLKVAFGGFESTTFNEFWYWVESLWAWNSATYIYVCMVHLPCWVLCVYILLLSC